MINQKVKLPFKLNSFIFTLNKKEKHMRKKLTVLKLTGLLFLLVSLSTKLYAQSTLNLLSNLAYDGVKTTSSQSLSDIWGYATDTHEFAIVGLRDGNCGYY